MLPNRCSFTGESIQIQPFAGHYKRTCFTAAATCFCLCLSFCRSVRAVRRRPWTASHTYAFARQISQQLRRHVETPPSHPHDLRGVCLERCADADPRCMHGNVVVSGSSPETNPQQRATLSHDAPNHGYETKQSKRYII